MIWHLKKEHVTFSCCLITGTIFTYKTSCHPPNTQTQQHQKHHLFNHSHLSKLRLQFKSTYTQTHGMYDEKQLVLLHLHTQHPVSQYSFYDPPTPLIGVSLRHTEVLAFPFSYLSLCTHSAIKPLP